MAVDPAAMMGAFNQAVADKKARESQTANFQSAVDAKLAAEAATKAAEKEAAAMERLKKVYGDYAGKVAAAQKSTEAMGKSLRDGSYAKATRDLAALTRQAEKYRREGELMARYGSRVGKMAARAERVGAVVEPLAQRAMTATEGLYHRGMSGTVEQGRAELEKNLLGREVAGIFKPVSDATTGLTRKFRTMLQGLNEKEQNALMVGGMGVAGGLGLLGMVRGGRGGMAALAGGAAAAGTAGGLDVGTTAAVGMTAMQLKMMLDAKKAAPPLAAPAVPSALPGGVPPAPSLLSRFGGYLAAAGTPGLAAAGVLARGTHTIGTYEKRRDEGGSRFGSIMRAFGDTALDAATLGGYSTAKMVTGFFASDPAKKKTAADEDTHRRVMQQGGGFQELGSGYDQLAEGFGKVYGGEDSKVADKIDAMTVMLGALSGMLAPAVAKVVDGEPPAPVERVS